VEEQISYYRRRAAEYDETSAPPGDPLAVEGERLRSELRAYRPRGRVLEIACGTGSWTGELLPFADELTALDASPEMLDHNRRKFRSESVRYVEADVFSWTPDATYDVVFFAFWLSHVPLDHFERFWALVASALAPGGRVFFIDEGRHFHWREKYVDEEAGLVRRRLLDGSEHRAIKVLWEPAALEERLRDLGWDVHVRSTGAFFWGRGAPSRRPAR
jgi:demethylmenaquinone methyltransferase/2-methoxy-6-polyprenyl-1,4-benzoquinol methylase